MIFTEIILDDRTILKAEDCSVEQLDSVIHADFQARYDAIANDPAHTIQLYTPPPEE